MGSFGDWIGSAAGSLIGSKMDKKERKRRREKEKQLSILKQTTAREIKTKAQEADEAAQATIERERAARRRRVNEQDPVSLLRIDPATGREILG
jgi:hypothetical protein